MSIPISVLVHHPERLLSEAAVLWPQLTGGRARLINHSENHTFAVDTPEQGRFALRVHRAGHLDPGAIRVELDWLAALSAQGTVPVPQVIPGRDGDRLVTLPDGRLAVLFKWIDGREPELGQGLADVFEAVGAHAARLHAGVKRSNPDPERRRPEWTVATVLGSGGAFGDWREGPDVTPARRRRIERALDLLSARLEAYGHGGDRFGLVHADMRLANLLVSGRTVTLIDFDDCGWSWFLYDFGAAVSFFETDPCVAELARAWIRGYVRVAPLKPDDVGLLAPMVLFRRIALLAWIGSHAETTLAQAHARHFAEGTALLADRFVSDEASGRIDPFGCMGLLSPASP